MAEISSAEVSQKVFYVYKRVLPITTRFACIDKDQLEAVIPFGVL